MSNTNTNNLTIFFVSLGCDKNLVDSEVMLGILREHGFTLVDDEMEQQVFIMDLSFNPEITDELLVIYFDLNKDIFCITHES